jgi:hypothetical protein
MLIWEIQTNSVEFVAVPMFSPAPKTAASEDVPMMVRDHHLEY